MQICKAREGSGDRGREIVAQIADEDELCGSKQYHAEDHHRGHLLFLDEEGEDQEVEHGDCKYHSTGSR